MRHSPASPQQLDEADTVPSSAAEKTGSGMLHILAHGHTAGEWQGQDRNLGSLALRVALLISQLSRACSLAGVLVLASARLTSPISTQVPS